MKVSLICTNMSRQGMYPSEQVSRQGMYPSEQAIHTALGEAGRSIQNRFATAAPFKTPARSSVV